MNKKGILTKEKILDVARLIIWQNNYNSISIDQIVQHAGVNKATFYNYFDSKETLAFEIIKKNMATTLECVYDYAFKTSTDPIERIELIVTKIYEVNKQIFSQYHTCPGCPIMNLGIELAFTNTPLRVEIQHVFDVFHSYWSSIYDELVTQNAVSLPHSPQHMGKRIQSVLNGAMINARLNQNPEDILEAIPSIKLLLHLNF